MRFVDCPLCFGKNKIFREETWQIDAVYALGHGCLASCSKVASKARFPVKDVPTPALDPKDATPFSISFRIDYFLHTMLR